MKEYVVGFAFWDGQVLLIHKQKGPNYVVGKLNGIGGKVEETDLNSYHSMSREFLEETGINTDSEDWEKRATMRGNSDDGNEYILHIFCYYLNAEVDYSDVSNPEDTGEDIYWVPMSLQEEISLVGFFSEKSGNIYPVENLSWIIPLCLDYTTSYLEISE